MSRFIRALSFAVLATAMLATTAAAVKPDRYPANLEGFVLEGVCAFDIQLDILVDRSYAIDFFDQEGSLVRTNYFGTIVIRLTNLDTQQAIDINVGGPASDRYLGDGTILTTFLGLGLPLITDSNLTRGNFQFLFSAGFEELLGTPKSSGFTQDLCPLLGG